MNKSVATIFAIIAAVVIILLIWWAVSGESENMPNIPDDTNGGNETPIDPSPTVEAKAPAVITGTNVAASDTTVVLTGQVTPNGSPTSYWFEYGTSASMGQRTTSQMIGSGFRQIPTPAYITGLSANTTYFYRLSAQNQFGTVSGIQYSFKTTQGNPPPVGSAPVVRTLAADDIERTTADLRGEVTPNRATTQYWFEYGRTANLGEATALTSAGDGTAKQTVSISLSDLLPNTTYYFRMNAQNQFGTVNGSTLNFKTDAPATTGSPTVVTESATAISANGATLNGKITPNGLQTRYWFEYSTDSLLGSVLLETTDEKTIGAGSNQTSVTASVSDLNPDTKYYFQLVGQNSSGTVRGDRLTFDTN